MASSPTTKRPVEPEGGDRRDWMQTSFNFALGSAMAGIGLTISTIAIAARVAHGGERLRQQHQ